MKTFLLKLFLFSAPFIGWLSLELFALPFDYFAFRPWDVMTVNNVAWERIGPFLPDWHLTKLEWGYADYLFNYLDAKPKLTHWATDRHGQRNRPRGPEPERYEVIIHGDSNIVGSYLDQSDTLSETLERKCGCPVYSVLGSTIWFDDDSVVHNSPRFLIYEIPPHPEHPHFLLTGFTVDGWRIRPPLPWPKWVYIYKERLLKQPSREYLRARLGLTGSTSSAASLTGMRAYTALVASKTDAQVFAELEAKAVRMYEVWRAKGTDVIFLLMPAPSYAPYAGLMSNLRRRGIGVVDFPPTPELPKGYPDDYWQRADSHWTEKAVRDTADRLVDEMNRRRGVSRPTWAHPLHR